MKKRFLAMSALLAVLGATGANVSQAQVEEVFPLTPAPTATGTFDESPTLWFVELKGNPKASGGTDSALAAQRHGFRTEAASRGILFTERFVYDELFNGLSIAVGASQVAALRTVSSVKAVYPVASVSLPEPQPGPSPALATAISQTQVDIAQNSLGLSGAGLRVAVMDTGLDVDHPDLGGCFGPGCRIEVGHDFVGDAYNFDSTSPAYNPVPVPDALPDDCNGHGTHVAGIVGANGAVKGVAPGVTFGAYRVFGCAGSTSEDVMIVAMEQIARDGADILNMSISSYFVWPQYPTAQAAARLVEKGMVVVASAGNVGANGLYGTSAPALGEGVISVAAFDNVAVRAKGFTVSPDDKPIGYNQATAAPTAPLAGSLPMARTGTATSAADACAPLPAGSLAGKAVLIRRGTCGFHVKALNAQNAGAAAVIIYNNAPGLQSITVAGVPPIVIPVVSITAVDGVLLDGRIAAGPVTLTWQDMVVYVPNVTGNTISTFSSYGLSPDLGLKPDIGAPGGQIYSTFPLEKGGYLVNNGTSMAAPHVAGAVALLLEARPGLSPREISELLQNTAEPKAWWGNPALGFLDNAHRQGAGMVQIADAIQSPARVSPSNLSLGESETGPATRTLTVHNTGGSAITYGLAHVPALSTGPNTYTVTFPTGFASAAFSSPTVTVPAGGSASVDVTITANSALADRSIYGGYIVLSPQGGGQALSVPYAGFKGDYQSIQAIVPTVNGFPWLAKLVGSSYVNQPGGASYTLQGNDIPFLIVHFDHQVSRFQVEVRHASSGQPVHPVFYYAIEDEYLPRNAAPTSFFAFPWDGTRQHNNGNDKTKPVPNGQYRLTIKALKALGDPGNPAHWETWTSPVVTLARP